MNYRKEINFKISADVYSYISEPKWSRDMLVMKLIKIEIRDSSRNKSLTTCRQSF